MSDTKTSGRVSFDNGLTRVFVAIDCLAAETADNSEEENVTQDAVRRAKALVRPMMWAAEGAGVPWKAPHLTSAEGGICFEWVKDAPRRRLMISVDRKGLSDGVGAPDMRIFWRERGCPTAGDLRGAWRWFSGGTGVEGSVVEHLGDSVEISEDIAGGSR